MNNKQKNKSIEQWAKSYNSALSDCDYKDICLHLSDFFLTLKSWAQKGDDENVIATVNKKVDKNNH